MPCCCCCVGVEIEEPFSILALDKLCKDVEKHVTDMLAMDETAMAVGAAGAGQQEQQQQQAGPAAEQQQPAYSR